MHTKHETDTTSRSVPMYPWWFVMHSIILWAFVHLQRKQPVMLDLKHLTLLWQSISTEHY